MKAKNYFFSAHYWNKLVLKFKNIYSRITEIRSGEGKDLGKLNYLLDKLRKIYKKLSRLQAKAGVKIAGSALALMLATSNLSAQDFTFHNALRSSDSSLITGIPVFEDMDNDGDDDLFVSSYYYTQYLEHSDNNQFNFSNFISLYGNSAEIQVFDIGDIDNDGDLEALLLDPEYYASLLLYKRTNGNFSFVDTLRTDDGNIINLFVPIPKLTDFDNDGDLDLYIGAGDGYIHVYKNNGSGNFTEDSLLQAGGSNIHFETWTALDFADIDNDGDLDFYATDNYNYHIIFYQNNNGTLTDGDTVQVNGSNLHVYYSFPALSDIDRDGDIDLALGGFYGYLSFLRNSGDGTFDTVMPLKAYNLPLNFVYESVPAVSDIDNDGNIELYVGSDNGLITKLNRTSDFDFQIADTVKLNDSILNVGWNSYPVFSDIDDDGVPELFIGTGFGFILKTNIDENANCSELDTIYNKHSYGNPNFTVADIGNGNDLFIMENDSIKEYNFEDPNNLSLVKSLNYNDSLYQFPVGRIGFVDLDADDDLDLYIAPFSSNTSYLLLYKNDGNQNFSGPDTLNLINNPLHEPIPIFYDLDSDGDLDIIAGSSYGKLGFFTNNTIITDVRNITNNNAVVYPNPTDGQLTIDGTLDYNVLITDINGRILKQFNNVNTDKLNIDLTNQSPGIYFVKMFNNKEVKTAKIIIR